MYIFVLNTTPVVSGVRTVIYFVGVLEKIGFQKRWQSVDGVFGNNGNTDGVRGSNFKNTVDKFEY